MKTKKNEFTCPHCKGNLLKFGFRTEETVYKTFDWQWDKKKKYFENDDGDTDNSELNDIFCNNCDADIREYVEDNNLI